jgi:hypothetical protein
MAKLVLFFTISVLILFKAHIVQAQTKSSEASFQTTNLTIQFPPGYNVIVNGERIPGVVGSQYLSEEWGNGRITFNDGHVIDSISLRLNAYRNEMHFLDKGTEYSIGCPDKIKEVLINNRKFIYYPYKEDNSILHKYFEVLVEGKVNLLVLFTIKRIESNYNIALSVGEKDDHLELSEQYFVAINNSIIKLDKRGSKLFNSLGEKGDALKKWIKEEDLSFKKKEDLVKIVSYMNEIN